MHRWINWFSVVWISAWIPLLGCAPTKKPPTPKVYTQAIFDPLSNPVQVPLPTDLVRDQSTGILQVPISTKDTKAQQSFNQYLNTLNGFPTSVVPEVRFSAPLDPKTVSDKTIKVYDATYQWPTPVEGLTFEVLKVKGTDAKGKTVDQGLLRVWNFKGWARGKIYVLYVMGGENGVKDAKGKPVGRSPLFDLVTKGGALCDLDLKTSFDASSGKCVAPSKGGAASGCCQSNTSGDLAALVGALSLDNTPSKVLEAKYQTQMRSMGSTLEVIRRGYESLVGLATVAGFNPDDVAIVWNFSTVSLNEAVFDPAGSPPSIPLPSDLLRNAQTGLVKLPINPKSSDAEQSFTAYLNTLNGFSLSANTAKLNFLGALDPKSVKKGILLFELSGQTAKQLDKVEMTYDEATKTISAKITTPLGRGNTYIAVALGGSKGIKNATGNNAVNPRRSAMMHLVLSEHPLCTCKGKVCNLSKGAKCDAVTVSSFIDDPKSKKGGLTGIQKAMSFEGLRQRNEALLKVVQKASTIKREDIISLWSYTITSMAEITFDPTIGVIPFPNDLLRDPKTGLVNIPASPGETEGQKLLREGLNTLDGFTTLGSYYVTYTGKIDKSSVKLGESIVILDLATGKASTDWKVEVVESAPAIVVTPTKPLKENNQYAIIMLSKLKEGSLAPTAGLKDAKGNRVTASPFMALLRNQHSLYKDGKSTISLLDDATAKQAEPARVAHVKLFDTLKQIKMERKDIVAAWTFTTQSITKPLTQLRALPWQILAKVDGNQPQWSGTLVPAKGTFPPKIPLDAIDTWAPKSTFMSWLALDENGTGAFLPDPTKGKPIQVPLAIFIPKSPMPKGGYPVAIFTHGIGRAKEDVLSIANSLAQGGMVVLSFDVLYHGGRTRCTTDEQCDGTCNKTKGTCSNKFKDEDKNGIPDASGLYFLRTDNPFAVRDNFRQHVIDMAALLRGIVRGAFSGIKDTQGKSKVFQLNPARVHLIGQSLGSILSTLVLATDSLPKRAVLNVPGGPVVDIIFSAPNFGDLKKGILKAQNVKEGTLDYLRLLTTFKWILDPADPSNFGVYLTQKSLPDLLTKKPVSKKEVIVQLAGKDETIPINLGRFLADTIGIPDADLTKTTFPKQGHAFLLAPDPKDTITATIAAQKQAVTFLLTGKICTPDPATGACK